MKANLHIDEDPKFFCLFFFLLTLDTKVSVHLSGETVRALKGIDFNMVSPENKKLTKIQMAIQIWEKYEKNRHGFSLFRRFLLEGHPGITLDQGWTFSKKIDWNHWEAFKRKCRPNVYLAFILYSLFGLDQVQTGEILHISPGTVRSRVTQALTMMSESVFKKDDRKRLKNEI